MLRTPDRSIPSPRPIPVLTTTLIAGAILLVVGVLAWQAVAANGSPDPSGDNLSSTAVVVDTGVLVFREGLEAILVLAAITASFARSTKGYRKPIGIGAAAGFLATMATWVIVVAILSAVNVPTLDLQAATGLLAVVVLIVIMNWFFHKFYWAGWISLHNRKRRDIVAAGAAGASTFFGFALLGFASVYREGVEVVLFLQALRLKVGSDAILEGAAIGLLLTLLVGWLTFVAHEHLPYKRMLVVTGVTLGFVLLVMVGESAQELQQAGWIGTTNLNLAIPDWLGVWFSVFPNVESIAAQLIAAALVLGSYAAARSPGLWRPRRTAEAGGG